MQKQRKENGLLEEKDEHGLRFNDLIRKFIYTLNETAYDNADNSINDLLEFVAEFFGMGAGFITQLSNNNTLIITHQYTPSNRTVELVQLMELVQTPWFIEKVRYGEIIKFERIPEDLPGEALKTVKRFSKKLGIRSFLGLPLGARDKIVGNLLFFSFDKSLSLSKGVTEQINLIITIFQKILLDKRIKEKLTNLYQFEKALSEISSKFTKLEIDKVDNTIRYGLKRVGTVLGAERCNFTLFDQNSKRVIKIISWKKKGMKRPSYLDETDSLHQVWPWCFRKFEQGEVVQFSEYDELPEEAIIDKKNFQKYSTKSFTAVPIKVGGDIIPILTLNMLSAHRKWPKEITQRLNLLGEVFANSLLRKQKELEMVAAFNEIDILKSQLETDYNYLREEIDLESGFHNMLGKSTAFEAVISQIKRVAPIDTNVLITGETGTGKELVARAIHDISHLKNRPLIKLSCAALSKNLIESELFGHEKGAFTNAFTAHAGRFELANGSTLFLDEIGELPIESQAKLLRVLQEGEFERLGSSRTIKVNTRIIAATNRNLEQEVKKGLFRQDLWYRLNIFPIHVPPLRHRKEDIPILTDWFTNKFSKKIGKKIKRIPENLIKTLQSHQWSGNVRELENIIERAVINAEGPSLKLVDDLSSISNVASKDKKELKLEEVERNHIIHVLQKCRWRINGPKGAAIILGLNPSTLRSRMQKLGI